MYYEHFGLTQAPFKITPNTEFFFSGGNRGPVLEALIYAITRGEGIVKVTGEVGSGKTMLCSMLQNRLPESVESVYLANPSVAPEEVLHAIAFELQLAIDRRADRLEVLHALQDGLVKRHAEGKRVVVFIEESQSMPLATLEEIRLLSNLETRNDKLLQIVLFGQPELDENLRRREIRQLRDRIAHSFRLQPLNDDEVREYLMFRMRAAGYRGPETFSAAVVKQIARASSGLTRRVNLIADKALLAAFSENTHTIRPRHVRAAMRDSEFGPEERQWRLAPAWAWAAAILVIGAGAGALLQALVASDGTAAPVASTAPEPSAPASAARAEAQPPKPPQSRSDARAPAMGAMSTIVAPAAAAVPEKPVESRSANAQVAIAPPPQAEPIQATPAPNSPARAAPPPPAPPAQPAPGAQPAAPTQEAGADTQAADPIARRLAATDQWLASAKPDGYSIQLLAAEDERQLRFHLKGLPKFIEINDLYMYRSTAHRRPIMNVLWGTFEDREAAQDRLAELPPSLRANRPYVRTMSGIRSELQRQRQR